MLLLSDALSQISAEVLPSDVTEQKKRINAVCRQFFAVGKWDKTTVRWRGTDTAVNFAVFADEVGGRYFTLPRQLLTILGGGHGPTSTTSGSGTSCCHFSADRIRGPWYEFAPGGWGVGCSVAGSGIQDAGYVTTFRDFSTASYLRVKTEAVETDPTVMLFRGLDQNGEEIYTGSAGARYQGVNLDIGDGLTTTTTQQFSAPPTLIKKPVTFGVVRLYAVSVADATETLIGIYDPGDTNPNFRRYRIACASDTTTVHAMVKRRFINAVADADEVIPGNVDAIELGLSALTAFYAKDRKAMAQDWANAYALLNAELAEVNGPAVPRFDTEPGFGLARIPRI